MRSPAVFLCGLLLCFSVQAASPLQWTWSSEGSGLKVHAEIQPGVYIYADKVALTATSPGDVVLLPDSIPASAPHKDAFGGAEVQVLMSHDGSPVEWSFPSAKLRWPLTLKLEWQGCRDASPRRPALCFMPETLLAKVAGPGLSGVFTKEEEADVAPDAASPLDSFKVARSASGYLDVSSFLSFLKGEAPPNPFAGRGFLAMAFLALLGGLALNLTPCVLPMIPINLAIIGAGAGKGGSVKAASRGLVYGAGMALAYGALGLVAAFGWASFGQINSTWWFNIGAGLLFVALALAMFGIFELDLSRYSSGLKLPSEAQFFGIFALGAVSAMLAGACVAPVLIAVLLHSAGLYAEGDKSGLLLPFILGVGMALPWPLAGAGLAFLPKPGAWMLWVKRTLGVLVALLAVYYLWSGASLLNAKMSMADGSDASPASQLRALDGALKASLSDGKPVFVDFWASWCKSCAAMEATTFKDEGVKVALKGFHVVKFRAEDPSDAATRPSLERMKVVGLPAYLVLEPAKP